MIDTKALRKKILDLAMRGKLVPQDPNDEPASELLKRIKAEKEELIKQKKIKRDKNGSEIFRSEDGSHYEKFADGTVKSVKVPYEVPEGWEWTRIKNVSVINPRNKLDDELIVSFVPMTLINDGFGYEHTSEEKEWRKIKSGFNHFQEGDIALAKITPSFQNRKSAILTNLKNGYGAGTTEIYILRPILNRIHYVFYFIESPKFIENGKNNLTGVVGQQRIPKIFLEDFLFPIPPISEQTRIVKQIQHYFYLLDIIDQNQSDLQQLSEQLRQKVLDIAMQGKLVPQDPNDEPASVLLEKIREEKQRLFEEGKLKKKDLVEVEPVFTDDNAYYENFPKSWEISTLGNIINLISGRDLRSEKIIEQPDLEGVPYITGASDFHKGTVITNRQTLEPQVISKFGDILITVKGTVGELGVNLYSKAHIARQVMAIRPYLLDKLFLQYFLSYKIRNIKSQSQSMIPGVSREVLLKLTIQLPPKEEQKRISNFIQLLFEAIDQVN